MFGFGFGFGLGFGLEIAWLSMRMNPSKESIFEHLNRWVARM